MSSEQMQAIVIESFGGPEVLKQEAVPKPAPQRSEVVVRIKASALNRADILQRSGKYPPPPGVPANIPGLEFAGEIESVAADVRQWKVGDRVMGLSGGGAHAEYLLAHERTLALIPRQLGFEEAASIPEAFITAHDAMWVQAALRPGERVLIHAAGSGVGLAAIQLARAMHAVPFGTARSSDKLERAKGYGLEAGFVVPATPTAEDGKRWAGQNPFDVILDLIGGAYTNASLHALAAFGRIMLIGTMGGGKAEIDSGLMLAKRARMIGTVLRARPLEEKIIVTRRFAAEVLPLFSTGMLRVVIDSRFALHQVRAAHERMESNQNFGKIVLCIGN